MPDDDDNSLPPNPTSTSTSTSTSSSPLPDQILENVLETVLVFLTSRHDRNAASLVCKSWYRAEALTRSDIFIGNCYSVLPSRVTARFRNLRSVVIKGKPRFADFQLMPVDWGAHFAPWATALGGAYPGLERIYLKRMSVTDYDLAFLAHSLPRFESLTLVCCEGFGTSGLAMLASKCSSKCLISLRTKCPMMRWIGYHVFPNPDGETNLESLTFDCVDCPINFDALERLVARSPCLKKLRVNRFVSIEQLSQLMLRATQLSHLGTGAFSPSEFGPHADPQPSLESAFSSCTSLSCLSGFRDIVPEYLPAIYPACANLTSLNFSYANIDPGRLNSVISRCHKLQVLWVLDSISDEGLRVVAATCQDLVELCVFPIDAREDSESPVSDVGFRAISEGCRKLHSILFFCQRMTNAAVIAMSNNCPDLVVFRLCIMGRHRPDHVTGAAMDEGFGAIVKNCKKLTRLAISGLLTDRAFHLIGNYGKLVRTLSVAFAGDSDNGLRYVLEGCPNLQKLEIRDSPFGDLALRSGIHHFYNMRFIWMSSCRLTKQCCQEIAQAMPRLVVEIFSNDAEHAISDDVDVLYMYRSLDGPRSDVPTNVTIL